MDRNQPRFRLWSAPVLSWALYDFANTIFSLAVITRYFNDWVIEDLGNPDWYISAMSGAITFGLVLTMAPLGAVADHLGRRKPFLLGFTAASVLCTALLATADGTATALLWGGLAIYSYQSALAHYDPMLADVAPPAEHGRISGFGVGLGYVGAGLGLAVLILIVGDGNGQQAFLPTAAMFALFSLPLAVFVKDRGRGTAPPPDEHARAVAAAALTQLATTIRRLPDFRDIFRLLAGRFFYADALAVIITYMTVFLTRLGTFSEAEKSLALFLSIPAAVAGAVIAGRIVDRVGPRWVLRRVILLFAIGLMVEAATGSTMLVWLLGPVVGIGLGATWTADRVFMMRLTPPAERGEFFGLYNLVGKLSNAAGPAVWGITIFLLHNQVGWTKLSASRAALAALGVVALIGVAIIWNLDDSPRDFPDAAPQ